MDLDFVNFEQAKVFRDVGFHQRAVSSIGWYSTNGQLNNSSIDAPLDLLEGECYASTLERVARWLMEEKGILTIPKHITRIPNEFIYQDWVKIKNRTGFFTTGKIFSTYEEALSVGIDEAIEMLKSNNNI